jgi:hypothetical protein
VTRKELYILFLTSQFFAWALLTLGDPVASLFPFGVSVYACIHLVVLNYKEFKDSGGGPLSPA